MTKITVAFLKDILNRNFREEISFTKMVELLNNQLRPEDEAMNFIKRLRDGGKIVSSGDLSNESISQAQACKRFFIDNDSFGYVYFPKETVTPIANVSNSFCDLNPDFQQYLIEQGEMKCKQCGKKLKAK